MCFFNFFLLFDNSFEDKFGVKFIGINDGPITNERDRIIQFMTNINIVMSVLDKNNLGNWLSERLIQIGDSVKDDMQLNANPNLDPFKDERLKVSNLPLATQNIKVNGSKENDVSIKLFEEPGNVKGTRRAISEIFKSE